MRRVSEQTVKEERLLLDSLEQDWQRLNRPNVNKSLKDSLYTRILEQRAHVATLEARLAASKKSRG